MAPKTRRSRGAAAAGAQSTLSFKNKVTKSSTPLPVDAKSKSSKTRLSNSAKEELVETITTPDPAPATITEPEPAQEPEQTKAQEVTSPTPRKKKQISAGSSADARDPREADAEKITDAQISKWWKQEEKERKAPRVHQESVPLHEKILRHFDLSGQYGSCIGITRLDRWKRANGLGLEPPLEVLAVLLREAEGQGNGKKGGRAQGCGTLAYIDELAGGRVGLVDA